MALLASPQATKREHGVFFSFGKTSGKLSVVSDLNYFRTDESESLDQLQTLLHQRHLALGKNYFVAIETACRC